MASQHSLWRCSFEKTHTGGMRHAAAKVYKPRLFGEGGKSRRAFFAGCVSPPKKRTALKFC